MHLFVSLKFSDEKRVEVNLKLRDDLVISRQEGEEGVLFVIKDLATDRFFRFKEIENYIAHQFDGNTSLEMISQRVGEKFGIELSREAIAQFAWRLQNIGLLVDKNASPTNKKKKFFQGDIFYLRFKLFNPDRFYDWVLPKVKFLFTPAFITISALLVLFAVSVTIAEWGLIMHEFYGLFRFEFLLQAWIIMLVVVAFHESAHGLTCKYFGGHVREVGFLLIYFQPAFFCNVSDAWLFPKKSSRMWVTFAGAYFEIFLWAVATLIWRITDQSTSINHFALVVTATSAFKMFFNMNPLIKLDGYYLLCDWMNIPNLRQKASNYLSNMTRGLFGFASKHRVDIRPREKRFLLAYSILSAVYVYWILGNIILWFGDVMTTKYQGWGFTIYTASLAVFFRRPLEKTISPVAARVGSFLRLNKIPLWFRWIIILGGVGASLFFIRMPLKVSGAFSVLPHHNADVHAQVDGMIEEIYVDESDVLKKGEVIARLSDRDYAADLRKTQAEIESKEAELKLLEVGPRKEEIEIARMQVQKTGELSELTQGQLGRDKTLLDRKTISLSEYERTKQDATIREKEFGEAKGKLKVLLAGSRQEEIEALIASIKSLQSHEELVKEQLKLLTVVSPIDGVVTTHKLKEKIGESVKKGDLITEVYELQTVMVEIAVPEKEIGDVSVGQKVFVKARAYPRLTFEGEVIKIAPVATKSAEQWVNDRYILVTTQLDNSAGLLKPEMTGNAKIYCGEYRLFDLLTRRIVRYLRVEFWSWW